MRDVMGGRAGAAGRGRPGGGGRAGAAGRGRPGGGGMVPANSDPLWCAPFQADTDVHRGGPGDRRRLHQSWSADNHAGKRSSAMICAGSNRGRTTDHARPLTITSGTKGRVLYVDAITAP